MNGVKMFILESSFITQDQLQLKTIPSMTVPHQAEKIREKEKWESTDKKTYISWVGKRWTPLSE